MRFINLNAQPDKTSFKSKAIATKTTSINEPLILGGDEEHTGSTRFSLFWDLLETINIHGYTRAAMSIIGRSAVGAWWTLKKHKEYGSSAKELHRRRLYSFYNFTNRPWDNIKDYYTFAYKLAIAVMYLRYFGFCAFHIIRDGLGNPMGMDFLHGFVTPNVDSYGTFKEVAFVQYLTSDGFEKVEYTDPKDIVYIVNPDWEGYVTGGSDMEALTDLTLPLDLYLQTAAREYMQNRNLPEGFYVLSPDVSDESFDAFVANLESNWSGPGNTGKNPIAVRGELDIKTVSKIPSQLPYQESRQGTRDETLAVSGVSGVKLGLSDGASNANIRDMRREFHETTMIPLLRFIEFAFYEQIHIREFGIDSWTFDFMNPDFLTAVEAATVDMRLYGLNALTPNQIRRRIGEEPRDDEFGDLYADQLQIVIAEMTPQAEPVVEEPAEEQGSPPEGREDEPDDPADIGEPTLDDQDPPRGDNHDDEVRNILAELRQCERYYTKRLGKTITRDFVFKNIPENVADHIIVAVRKYGTKEAVRLLFDEIIKIYEEELNDG